MIPLRIAELHFDRLRVPSKSRDELRVSFSKIGLREFSGFADFITNALEHWSKSK